MTSWFESNGPRAAQKPETSLGGVSDASSETLERQGRPYCLDHADRPRPPEEPVQACEDESERERELDKGVGHTLALEGRS
jgi:hypothetical protein